MNVLKFPLKQGILPLLITVLPVFFPGSLRAVGNEEDEYIARKYEWYFSGKRYSMSMKIPAADYVYYQCQPRTNDYASYVTEAEGHEIRPYVAAALRARAREESMNPWQEVNFVIAFVQGLDYFADEGEYPRYPVETLVDGGGDCEDTAALLAALLDELGYDCILMSPPGHMATGIAVSGITGNYFPFGERRYYYVETTSKNWEIGAVPDKYDLEMEVYPIRSANNKREILAYDPVKQVEGTLTVVFSRSEEGVWGEYSDKKAFRYALSVEGPDEIMNAVKEVRYRRMHPTFPEYQENGWIERSSRQSNFKSEWIGWGYSPVLVNIVFTDGSEMDYYLETAPVTYANK